MKRTVLCAILTAFILGGCGKAEAGSSAEIIQKKNQPDVEAFKAEIAEEQRALDEAAAAEEAELHRDWSPVGGYSCVTTNHTFYIRIESVNIDAGTAEVFYQISENGKEDSSGIKRGNAALKRTDNGDGNLEYEIIINEDIRMLVKGYIRDRNSTLVYKGAKLVLETHGNGK